MAKPMPCLQSFVQFPNKNIAVGKNFQSIVFYGQTMSFGRAQADIIRHLYDAGSSGHPYVHFKILLRNAGARSFLMGDVFKSNPYWHKIIRDGRRGFYRLDEAFFKKKTEPQQSNVTKSQTFQSICFRGEHLSFGRAQADIIRQLYNAGKTGRPYIHYKTLLKNAGARSSFMRDVFKSNPYWHKIIRHDRRGFYRLDEAFFKKKTEPQQSNVTKNQTFQSICFRGEHLSFGRAQADIIRQLYNSGKTGRPYIHYKTLLKNAGVRSSFMKDVFKSNPYWRKIIRDDRRGFYRLDDAFFGKKPEPQQSNVTKNQTFQSICFNGERLSFDCIQADIIRQLYDAGSSGHPYVHFKTLLRNAGVRPSFIREMSNSNPHWHKIIGRDRRGFYRLDEAFFPKNPGAQQPIVTMDPSFQSICFRGEYLSFGRIQANIIQHLYDAGSSGHPYVHFKILLRNSDSRSFFMSNAFKSNPYWRKIIKHDRRGFYRLDEAFLPKKSGAQQTIVTMDPSFQSICFRGEHLTFGLVQAHIIKQLYDAGKTGHPYVNFTELLEGTGCFSRYVKEIFKSNTRWRKIIQIEASGFYRLHEAFFKADYVQAVPQFPNQNITRNNDFRSICFYGEHFVFGATQANIIRRLYRAGKSDRPYIHGSILLEATGLNYDHISTIFNWRPYWRKIIESDGKGFYRLNRAFFEEEPAKI